MIPKEPWYIRYAQKHPVSDVIYGDDDKSPYLYRWHLIPKNKFINIFLHHFVGSDNRPMHNHPWVSLSYILSGKLWETYSNDISNNHNLIRVRDIKQGDWTYRGLKFCHKLFLLDDDNDTAWTIFITGPSIKKWGFFTSTGWKHHDKVLRRI